MALPDDYLELLDALATAFIAYEARTGHAPVLVGGAAVAIQTQGSFMSGDLDILAPNDEALADALVGAGFVSDERSGRLFGGFYHPRFPRYGVEAVSGQLFDGKAARDRLIRVAIQPGHEVVIPSFEDMIADRLGQHAIASPTDDSRLQQALLIYRLAESIDSDYLKRRVAEEGGDVNLLQGDLLHPGKGGAS